MVLCFTLPVAFFFLLWKQLDVEIDLALTIAAVAFHGVMGGAELLLGERREPDEERDWTSVYARWFGSRDW